MTWKDILKEDEELIKIFERKLGFSPKQFDGNPSYNAYEVALRETNNRKGFLKELLKRYKQNKKQPLTSAIVKEVLSVFKYSSGAKNNQKVSGQGVMGGNDYGF